MLTWREMASSALFATSLTVSFLSLTTSLINYLTMAVLAFFFGAGEEVDAFFAASTLPQILLAVISASLTNSFLPFFIEKRHQEEKFAWALASKFFINLAIVLFILALLGSFFAKPLVRFINPGFSGAAVHLAASLLRPLLFAFIFSGCSILLISLHFAQHRFILPSLTQLLNSLFTLSFLFFFRSSLGVKSIVLGTLAGSACQFIILWPLFLKNGRFSLKPKISLNELYPLFRLLLPLFGASLFYRANPFIERYFASQLGEGSIALLGYALKIITALILLLSQGISTVTFPRMAEEVAAGERAKLNQTFSQTYRFLFFILVPATFFLLVYRKEIVALLLERGQFSPEATSAVAAAILAYSGYFFLGALANPMVNVFYSIKKTALTALVGLSGFGLYVLLASLLSKKYNIIGIAAASSIQYTFTFLVFFLLLNKLLKPLPLKEIGHSFGLTIAGSFVSLAIITLIEKIIRFPLAYPVSILPKFILFCFIYFILMKLWKAKEIKFLIKRKYD